jgi:hypothetical protein
MRPLQGNFLYQPYVVGTGFAEVTAFLHDPVPERFNRARFWRDPIPNLKYANSVCCPAGRWPLRAFVLIKRFDYNAINKYATNLQLQIQDFNVAGSTPVLFQNLAIVQARCVSTGQIADPNAIYLVELTDGRGIVYNQWFQYPTTSDYNVRAPAYPQKFYDGSLQGGATWAFSDILADLWLQMGEFLGDYPNLPITPTGTPENFIFPGTSAWEALNDILDLLGLQIAADLTKSSDPYTIVVDGMADPALTNLQSKYLTLLEEDLDWIDQGSGRVPAQVTILFHRRNEYYGTEETVRKDSFQWSTTPFIGVSVAAPALFAGSVGTHYLWDDFTIRFDIDNNPLAADVTTANAIATERASQYYNRVYRGTQGFMRQIYAGTLPFVTGSLVDGVLWREDHRQRQRKGWVTELIRGPQPPWPEVEVHVE